MTRKAFTLVEMLVVIGIIAVLVALLIPAGAIAMSRTRNFNMSVEIAKLSDAIETYKRERGDYPPSMGEIDVLDVDQDGDRTESMYQPSLRYRSIAERHLRKCYPNIDRKTKPVSEVDYFYDNIAPKLTGDEALVFWLSLTQNDERNPFTSPSGNFKRYYDFKPEQLADFDGDTFPSYRPRYAKETPFVLLDGRHYVMHQQAQYAISGSVQAYCDNSTPAKYVNLPTFQIICAGQDGEFGAAKDQFDNSGNALFPKQFRSGINYTDEDRDNLTNFSEGKTLADHIP